MQTIRDVVLLALALLLLLAACGSGDHPAEDYLDRDGPARRSDTLAAAAVRLIERIQQLPMTGDRDVNLAREMIEHHKTTIEMNKILLRDRGESNLIGEKLKAFAERLSATHQKELEIMTEFLDWHPEVPPGGRRGTPGLMEGLSGIQPTDDIGAAYIELMQIHLRDGLALAEEARDRGIHEEIREPAAEMAQRAEEALAELEQLRQGQR